MGAAVVPECSVGCSVECSAAAPEEPAKIFRLAPEAVPGAVPGAVPEAAAAADPETAALFALRVLRPCANSDELLRICSSSNVVRR